MHPFLINTQRFVFDNLVETQERLRERLEPSDRVGLDIVGSMAIFAATSPRLNVSVATTA